MDKYDIAKKKAFELAESFDIEILKNYIHYAKISMSTDIEEHTGKIPKLDKIAVELGYDHIIDLLMSYLKYRLF
jgi:hypothetical protein